MKVILPLCALIIRLTKFNPKPSGETALNMLKQKMPDMAILDIMLPDIDGFTLLKEIRKVSKIPIIMLTAKGEAILSHPIQDYKQK